MKHNSAGKSSSRRRGATFVAVAVMLVMILGFAALTVDVGNLYVAKGELQRAADAAALAGASAFADDSLRELYADPDVYEKKAEDEAIARAKSYSILNSTTGIVTHLADGDIKVGYFSSLYPLAKLDKNRRPNAVEVTARFTESSVNGPIANFFAAVLGATTTDVSATATAAFDTHLQAYTPNELTGLMPFSIYRPKWEDQIVNGDDNFGFDEDFNQVLNYPDGKPELKLYPYPDDDPGGDGAGNFGSLNIGLENQGTNEFETQILFGIESEDLELEIGSPSLSFVGENGEPITYEMTGNPGLSGGIIDSLEAKIGHVVGFFLHDVLVDTGSNAVYTIVGLEFGRIMYADLTGSYDNKRLILQPVVYTDPGVEVDPEAPENGEIGKLMLVK